MPKISSNVTGKVVLEEKNPGATIIPIFLSSDKTQLTLFRGKMAYPLYLTIGNLPKEIRRKPSRRGQILLAYLPATKLKHIDSATRRRQAVSNLYHSCVGKVTQPLETAGVNGVEMNLGNGDAHRYHPLLACFISDYPEQLLGACCKNGTCPKCTIPRDRLGEDETEALRGGWDQARHAPFLGKTQRYQYIRSNHLRRPTSALSRSYQTRC